MPSILPSDPERGNRKLAILQGLHCLGCRPGSRFSQSGHIVRHTRCPVRMTYLESNVIIAYTDLQLLLPNYILLWPVGVIFPVRCGNRTIVNVENASQ